ncbi:oligosaccharide flippase family protein [Rubritepida flocculans]|uniref:oligosaccharide flippase family protein n=1 Tax=Rubritepida flocculans TaxID=182403 RepID=UPI000421F5E4|nr:oligosaccharide flippase family protein [Rubritepida flocculans]
MSDSAAARAGAGRLLSGLFWNALGRGLPLLLALLLTPVLIAQMGLERWGLFTLALALVGVFGIFDLGVGPALTRALSERMTHEGGRDAEAGRLVGTALLALGLFAALGAGLLWSLLPWLMERALNVPPALQAEALTAFRLLALAAPLVVVNAALWGVLAAHQRFRAANLVTIPVAAMYYIGPALVLLAWQSLVAVMLVLLACRLANTLSYAWLCRGLLPRLSLGSPALVWPLLRIGGWLTFASVLNQALLYADRFLIGALLTLAAVAHYATPLDLVLRMWIIPVAVAQALLPAMASAFRPLPEATAGLMRRGALLILALTLPPCLLLAGFGEFALRLWLGAAFAAEGGTVLRLLALGIFFSCLAYAPNALLEAIGRPDLTAKLVLAQVLLFLPLSALLLWRFGIEGAALAWALRALADAAGKLWLAARAYPAAAAAARALAAPGLAALAGLSASVLAPEGPWSAGAAAGGLLLAAGVAARALSPEERRRLRPLLRRPWKLREALAP